MMHIQNTPDELNLMTARKVWLKSGVSYARLIRLTTEDEGKDVVALNSVENETQSKLI